MVTLTSSDLLLSAGLSLQEAIPVALVGPCLGGPQSVRKAWPRHSTKTSGIMDAKHFHWLIGALLVASVALGAPPVFGADAAPDVTITGSVRDANGDPLAGATVRVQGTNIGSATNVDGLYVITVPDDATTLVFSFISFVTQEVNIGSRTVIDVVMTEDVARLEEVVVTGYGTQLRKDVTGSIASVTAADIQARPVVSVEEALQGLVPGLNVAERSAAPGELAQISIRAIGTLSAGYEPLWVIDGFPTDQRNAAMISTMDIESVDILKDASATAIYGSLRRERRDHHHHEVWQDRDGADKRGRRRGRFKYPEELTV